MSSTLVTFRAIIEGHGSPCPLFYLHVQPGDLADLRATLRRRCRVQGLPRLILETDPATARAFGWTTHRAIPEVHPRAELRLVHTLEVPAMSRAMAELSRGRKLGTDRARELAGLRHGGVK